MRRRAEKKIYLKSFLFRNDNGKNVWLLCRQFHKLDSELSLVLQRAN